MHDAFIAQDGNLPASVYRIVENEWERVDKMLEVLKVSGTKLSVFRRRLNLGGLQDFKMATQFLSTAANSYPLLSSVIATYNWILDKLEKHIAKYNVETDEEAGVERDVDADAMLRGLRASHEKIKKWYKRTTRSVYGNTMCERWNCRSYGLPSLT